MTSWFGISCVGCELWFTGRVSALHSVVADSISSGGGGDHGIRCWWDLIKSKQLSSISVRHLQVFAKFCGCGHSIKKKTIISRSVILLVCTTINNFQSGYPFVHSIYSLSIRLCLNLNEYHLILCFGFVSFRFFYLRHINLCRLLIAKSILVEVQWWYWLLHSWNVCVLCIWIL